MVKLISQEMMTLVICTCYMPNKEAIGATLSIWVNNCTQALTQESNKAPTLERTTIVVHKTN